MEALPIGKSAVPEVKTIEPPQPSRLQRAIAATLPCLALWLPAVLMSFYVKWSLMTHGGFRCVSRLLGRVDIPGMPPERAYLFSPLERLSFFRSDLLLLCIVAPLVGAAILYWIKSAKWRLILTASASFLTVVFLYLQLHGYWTVGQFQSWDLWRDALRWGWMHPEDAGKYGGIGMALKLGILLATFILATIILFRWQLRRPLRFLPLLTPVAGASGLLVIGITSIAWAAPTMPTVFHRSAPWICVRALLEWSDVDLARYANLDEQQVMDKWRDVTHTPAPLSTPQYFGAARDFDVICFVMETAPQRCLDVSGDMTQTPNMRLLREHAWTGPQHVSTYPYTRRAIFSIMTGWYPTSTEYYDGEGAGKITFGMMHSLKQRGYLTAAYKPYPDSADDERLHHNEDIQTVYYADAQQSGGSGEAGQPEWHKRATCDHDALERMKTDIASWIDANQRYAAVYLPQIGHAPWPDMTDDASNPSVIQRGRSVITLQDQWLGELIDVLKQKGRLDRTIIMITGDHGIRTRAEDPDFDGGLISPYSFRVPFLLYVPQVVSKPTPLPWVTSHIDVTPSVLDLIGVDTGRQFEMGAPIWDERLKDRTVYFWAGIYLGADGYRDQGEFAMWQRTSDTTSTSSTFDFDGATPMRHGTPSYDRVMDKITDGLALTHRITHLGSR